MKYSQLIKGLINFDPDEYQLCDDINRLVKTAKAGLASKEVLKKQADEPVEFIDLPPMLALPAIYDPNNPFNLVQPLESPKEEPTDYSGYLAPIGTSLGGALAGYGLGRLYRPTTTMHRRLPRGKVPPVGGGAPPESPAGPPPGPPPERPPGSLPGVGPEFGTSGPIRLERGPDWRPPRVWVVDVPPEMVDAMTGAGGKPTEPPAAPAAEGAKTTGLVETKTRKAVSGKRRARAPRRSDIIDVEAVPVPPRSSGVAPVTTPWGGVEAAVARALPPGSVTPRLPFDRQQYAQELAKQLLPSVGGAEARALLGGAETAAPALPPGGSPEPALPPVGRPEPALPPGGKPAPALPYVRDRSSVINAVVQKIRGRRVGAPKATPAIEFPERQLTLPGLGGARRMPPEKQLTLPGLGDLTGAATGRQLALPGLGAPAERQLTLPGLGDLTGAAPERPAPRAAPREPLIRVPEEVRRVLAGGTPKPAVPSFEALVKAVADDVRAKAKRPSPLEMARPAAPGIGRRLDITDVKKIVRESAIEARRKLLSGELAGGGADIRKMLEAARKRQARAARSAAKRSPVVSARQRLGRAFGRMKGAR